MYSNFAVIGAPVFSSQVHSCPLSLTLHSCLCDVSIPSGPGLGLYIGFKILFWDVRVRVWGRGAWFTWRLPHPRKPWCREWAVACAAPLLHRGPGDITGGVSGAQHSPEHQCKRWGNGPPVGNACGPTTDKKRKHTYKQNSSSFAGLPGCSL